MSETVELGRHAVGSWLAAHRHDLVEYLCELVRIPSENPPGDCAAIAQRVERQLRALGLDVERHDVPRDGGPPAPTILGWLGPRTPAPALLLNAHVDAIPPGEGWTVEPLGGVVRDGRVYGRGAAVSKSDVAGYAYALAAVGATAGTLSGSAVVAITADEETGGYLGPRWLVDELALRPGAAICAGFTHGVVVAHNGCIQGRFAVRGRSAHAAMPWNGVDAIALARRVLEEIDAEHERLAAVDPGVARIDRPTLVATRIGGGGPQGVVAASVEVAVDRRVVPSERIDDALAGLEALAARAAAGSPGSVEFEADLLVEPLRPTPQQAELARLLAEEGRAVVGHELEPHGVPIFTDARWFDARGIPTVLYGAGPADPGEARGHGPDENVVIADVLAATEVVARVARRLLERHA